MGEASVCRGRWAAALASLLVVACGSTEGTSPPLAAVRPSPSRAQLERADVARVRAIELRPSELGRLSAHPLPEVPASTSPWTVTVNHPDRGASVCLRSGVAYDATWYRGFAYDENQGGDEGTAYVSVYAAPEESAIRREQVTLSTAGYAQCYLDRIERADLRDSVGTQVTGPSTTTRMVVDPGVTSATVTFATPYTFFDRPLIMYRAVMWLQHGRFRAALSLSTCCGPITAADLLLPARLLASRLRDAENLAPEATGRLA